MILYLTNIIKVNLLDFIEKETGQIVKKLTGNFSLLSFVVKDMQHFTHIDYIALDRTAILESDNEMVQALLSFQVMYDNIRIIIIAEGLPESSPLLYQLIRENITNVVTAEDIETMQAEIRECFSETGMTKHIKKISSLPLLLNPRMEPDIQLPSDRLRRTVRTNAPARICDSGYSVALWGRNAL